MSEDLRAYFLLKRVNLGKEERRSILLAKQSNYSIEGIEKALRVSYYDIHERERGFCEGASPFRRQGPRGAGKRGNYAHLVEDEPDRNDFSPDNYEDHGEGDLEYEGVYAVEGEEEPDAEGEWPQSDQDASADDEVFDAYAAMESKRQSYRDSRKKLRDIQKSRGFIKP